VAVPATVTSQAEAVLDGSALEVVRTVGSLAELTKASVAEGVIFAGAPGGGYVFPEFLPAYDATASLCKLLELLAPVERPLSELVRELPSSTLIHRPLQCPWAMKGTVMRELTERLRGREVDLVDGIKVFDDRGWAQVQPDPDQPLLHLYSEGRTEEESVDLEEELRRMVQEVMEGQEAMARR
jgi:mannose-1-phosphate guanylyltransferase / phosphomannomutase